MIQLKKMSMEKIRRKGIEVLARELGPYNLVRFLQQFETGEGDYTQERAALQRNVSVDEIVNAIKVRKR